MIISNFFNWTFWPTTIVIFFVFSKFSQSQDLTPSTRFQDEANLCTIASEDAAVEVGVPVQVLLAITLVETGRTFGDTLKPWPWVINQGGKGHWFSNLKETVDFVEKQLDLGMRNFDVGCFQINHRWHSGNFKSTMDMVDPRSNAFYAARLLKNLYIEKGDWPLAIAAYHSRTPEVANEYVEKFKIIFASLGSKIIQENDSDVKEHQVNRFPFLKAGFIGSAGSLVPLNPSKPTQFWLKK